MVSSSHFLRARLLAALMCLAVFHATQQSAEAVPPVVYQDGDELIIEGYYAANEVWLVGAQNQEGKKCV